jgi:hypothetical protein
MEGNKIRENVLYERDRGKGRGHFPPIRKRKVDPTVTDVED